MSFAGGGGGAFVGRLRRHAATTSQNQTRKYLENRRVSVCVYGQIGST